jgi:hypothetical protein
MWSHATIGRVGVEADDVDVEADDVDAEEEDVDVDVGRGATRQPLGDSVWVSGDGGAKRLNDEDDDKACTSVDSSRSPSSSLS